jgi:hypothetical protein
MQPAFVFVVCHGSGKQINNRVSLLLFLPLSQFFSIQLVEFCACLAPKFFQWISLAQLYVIVVSCLAFIPNLTIMARVWWMWF